jgi:hypothetical protein
MGLGVDGATTAAQTGVAARRAPEIEEKADGAADVAESEDTELTMGETLGAAGIGTSSSSSRLDKAERVRELARDTARDTVRPGKAEVARELARDAARDAASGTSRLESVLRISGSLSSVSA